MELDLNELWAVDVTAPDIETKSYMRNTLASENRCLNPLTLNPERRRI